MKSKITAELVRLNAKQFQGLDVSEARAAEIAQDLNRVNDAAISIAADADFNEEPSRFAWMLAQLQSVRPRR